MSAPTDDAPSLPAPERRIFVNRTLNLRSIRAVGFDMDYTLVHYRVEIWERHAYERARSALARRGWPVAELAFDPEFVILGLIIDLELGNLVKASRFGYVTRAFHGTSLIDFDRQRDLYSRTLVDLSESRWVFLNTSFSLSEALLFAQCVDLLDRGLLAPVTSYRELYDLVRGAVDRTHAEGALKAEIAANPREFVVPDPELATTLDDLKRAGKKLMLVTNSEWSYTRAMLAHVLGSAWQELFDISVVSARKPDFFLGRSPAFEIVSDDGLLRPKNERMRWGKTYLGGNARELERDLELLPEEILYVGDHLYSDVHVSKDLLRWRTTLILRDLEREILAVEGFREEQAALSISMAEKERLEHAQCALRLALLRAEDSPGGSAGVQPLHAKLAELRARLTELDERIAPLAGRAGELANPRWGLMMRSGIDKSYLARQLERYADAYTSRVSNFLAYTPFVYLRAARVSLPHDENPVGSE